MQNTAEHEQYQPKLPIDTVNVRVHPSLIKKTTDISLPKQFRHILLTIDLHCSQYSKSSSDLFILITPPHRCPLIEVQ